MSDPRYGEFYLPQSAPEIRDDILTDIRLELINNGQTVDDANLAVQPGTFMHLLATADANTSFVTRQQQAADRANLTPSTCNSDVLEQWRIDLGLADVSKSVATGKIRLQVTGTSTIPAGRELVLPNGLRLEVVGTWPGVTDGDEVDVVTIDPGDDANADGGTLVRFLSPPLNVETDAYVSDSSPLVGGSDLETEARKRERVLNRLSYAMGGGNWGRLREIAMEELSSVQNCFVYPALGGPSSVVISPVRGYDYDRHQYTRAMDDAALSIVRNAIHRDAPDSCQYVVRATVDEPVDVALEVTIPSAAQTGGDGSGWADTLVWPSLDVGETHVTVSAVSTSSVITVDASISAAPVAGLTRISWWSPGVMAFETRTVVAVSGSAGARVLTLDRPLVDALGNSVAVGDFICPYATNMNDYGATWVQTLEALGPGENVVSSENRRKRHPYVTDEHKSSLTITEIKSLLDAHPEITDAAWSYRSAVTPTVPANIDLPAYIFIPRRFGVYPI